MYTLRIEHAIVDFDTWKRAFDGDPVGRRQLGVRGYRVYRPVDDDRWVIIDLDFDDDAAAGRFLEAMQKVWSRAELSPGLARGAGAGRPVTRVARKVEACDY